MSSEVEDSVDSKGLRAVESTSSDKKASGEKKAKPKRKKPGLTINLTNCKYDSVRRVARRFGLRPVGDNEEWTVYWIDTSVIIDRVMNMKRYQKINHFPGMAEICRKDLLARNMNRMFKLFPREYNVFPRSWCMPADYSDFKAYCRAHKNKTFITKPESGSQGKGIIVFKNPKEIRAGEHAVVQQYIGKPFIIDGFKFDLRIYVVVTSCDPFRIYVYKDGLARFATVKYHEPTSANVGKQCMHLTNYAINKHSDDFIRDDDTGSKRRISTVNQWFIDNGYNLGKIWHDIDDVIIKTLISAHHTLKHNYRSCFPNHNTGSACFEILGFDILLDSRLKPWLVEVNHSPSFHTDSPLDKEVKEGLLHDTLNLVDLYANDKKKCEEEDRRKIKERLLVKQKSKEISHQAEDDSRAKYEAHLESFEKTHCGGLRRVYPNGNEDYYAPFFNQSNSLCAETAASKMRVELSRQQRQEIEAKQKETELFKRKLAPGGGGSAKTREDVLRPESPTNEKKTSSAAPYDVKRRTLFRLPQYNSAGHRITGENAPVIPCGDGVTPQTIKDEEELERLASLQLRDSLVRGLGVSEQLQAALDSESTPCDTRAPSVISRESSAAPKSLFFTNSVYHHRDSGIDVSMSGSSLPSDHHTVDSRNSLTSTNATSLHSLPGSTYHHLNHSNSIVSSSPYLLPSKRQGLGKTPPNYTASVKSLSAAYNRPSCAFGNRPPHPSIQGPPGRGALNRPQRQPPSLDLNPELFGLSVISAPIRLANRKQYYSPGRPPGLGIDHHSSTTAMNRIRHMELLATDLA